MSAAAASDDVLPTHQFRALDPQLPLLAAKAAAQLDNLRLSAQGHLSGAIRIDAVKSLADRLRSTMQDARSGVNTRALFDPITERVLSTAFAKSHAAPGPSDNEELGRAADSLALLVRQLEDNQQVSADQLAIWRDFCLALSSLAASRQQSIYGTRPHFRHRR